MIRDDIKAAQVAAMKAGDKDTRAAISLIQAAIKNRDIELRTGTAPADDDAVVVEVLLDHLLQHLDDEGVVVGGRLAGARLDVAVLDRGLDQGDSGAAFLIAGLHGGDLGGFDVVSDHAGPSTAACPEPEGRGCG